MLHAGLFCLHSDPLRSLRVLVPPSERLVHLSNLESFHFSVVNRGHGAHVYYTVLKAEWTKQKRTHKSPWLALQPVRKGRYLPTSSGRHLARGFDFPHLWKMMNMCPAPAVYEGRRGRVWEHGEDSQEGRPVFVSVTVHLFVIQVVWTPVNRTQSESLGREEANCLSSSALDQCDVKEGTGP